VVGGDSHIGTEATAPHAAGLRHSVPATIGRYQVVRCIGAGAMGTVYEAHDPELARKVAVKLLRHSGDRERLRREAQAMAQLSHENVVSVFDVGEIHLDDGAERVYVSMQLVEGSDLAQWLRDHPAGERSRAEQRELLQLLARAGRGLAAAHAVGLVHRDFKPANVLIGDGGSVRVADFGLARSVAATPEPAVTSARDIDVAPLLNTMTVPGVVVGTPQYMAPEQFIGDEVDSRCDQFAFCVALYEGLYGERPFAGRTFGSLRRNVTRGRIREPRAGVHVPARLRKLALRGLRSDPQQRYPSMDALVAELERKPWARLRIGLQVLLVAAAVAALAFALFGPKKRAAASLCKHAADHVRGVWDPPRKAAVRSAFTATRLGHASAVFERVETRLDRYVNTWVTARTDTCEATHVRGEQSAAVMDLRMRCLDRRLSAAGALVSLFANHPDRDVLNRAIDAVAMLPPIAQCDDVDALRAVVPLPVEPGRRAEAQAIERVLDDVEALQEAGKYRRALASATEAARRADALGYSPVRARALFDRGNAEARSGKFKSAEATYYTALGAAGAARDDRRVARILIALVAVVGDREGMQGSAEALATVASAAIKRVGSPPGLRAALLASRGRALLTAGKYAEAEADYERALALRRKALGDAHPDVARSLNAVAVALYNQRKLDAAERYYRQALELGARVLGPDHPHVAAFRGNLGNVLLDRGKPEAALAEHEKALASRLRALGPDNVYVANSLHSLGRVAVAQKRYGVALIYFRRALATLREALGADYPDAGIMESDVADALRLLGKLAEARQHYQHGLRVARRALGKRHVRLAPLLIGLSRVEAALGHRPAAIAAGQKAVAILAARSDRAGALAEARAVLAAARRN